MAFTLPSSPGVTVTFFHANTVPKVSAGDSKTYMFDADGNIKSYSGPINGTLAYDTHLEVMMERAKNGVLNEESDREACEKELLDDVHGFWPHASRMRAPVLVRVPPKCSAATIQNLLGQFKAHGMQAIFAEGRWVTA